MKGELFRSGKHPIKTSLFSVPAVAPARVVCSTVPSLPLHRIRSLEACCPRPSVLPNHFQSTSLTTHWRTILYVTMCESYSELPAYSLQGIVTRLAASSTNPPLPPVNTCPTHVHLLFAIDRQFADGIRVKHAAPALSLLHPPIIQLEVLPSIQLFRLRSSRSFVKITIAHQIHSLN